MVSKFLTLLFLFLPAHTIAQSILLGDTAFERLIEMDCDGKEFTKTEIIPSLKVSREAFEDSLTLYLKTRNTIIINSAIPFRFFLTSQSQIVNLRLGSIHPTPEKLILRDAILHFSNLWRPAVQNHQLVCSYVTFIVEFTGDKTQVYILQ